MASYTNYLQLVLPGLDEYFDSWYVPNNANFSAIDLAIQGIGTEIIAARQTKTSLLAFLQVAHNADGTLLAAPEVVRARVSPVYGWLDTNANPLPLSSRLDDLDFELLAARRGQATLLDSLAFARGGVKNQVLSGAADGTGAPAWLGSTAASVRVDGATAVIYLLVNGYVNRIRTSRTLVITGAPVAPATYTTNYLVATRASAGYVTVDGTVTSNGQTSTDNSGHMTIFTDTAVNFAALDVQPGDILTLTSSGDAGTYVIAAVAPLGPTSQLQIIGTFPVGALSSIAYTVKDPLGVTLSFQRAATLAAGQMIFGEADFDGTAVTAVRPRQFGDSYYSPWQFVDVSTTATFSQAFKHLLGSDILDIQVHVSQANDGSLPVEMLSLADLTQATDLALTSTLAVVDTKTVTAANTLVFNPGTSNATLTGGATSLANAVTATLGGSVTLTGGVSGTAGAVTPSRSVAVSWDRNQVYVRNVTPSLLYKDYNNAQHQTGYVRVIVQKRG